MTAADSWEQVPTLRGEFVLLRPTVPADARPLAAAYDDEGTLEYFPFGVESDPPSAATVEYALASGRQVLTQVDLRSGAVCGSTSLHQHDRQRRQLTIGHTWLSASVRGGPVNVEAKLLLMTHAFDTLRAVRVQWNVDDRNARSRRAVLGLGATEEGVLRRHARRRDGTWRDTVVFSVLDTEWPEVRERLTARVHARTGGRQEWASR
ncbi:GNAT family N-acetyltransferase [Frankia sp. AiPa1]|uniref:GNAT family N-acetyltransferase n=1 Tax=Frankia sp. AiPa1 TaxID=573492 RepID=UPI00202B2844|nr:GNAT family protein [Frankia sp. AiPa1]MCL9760530.1 GNAT family N-acetyltransferase [Frankia sp. AiPa1]